MVQEREKAVKRGGGDGEEVKRMRDSMMQYLGPDYQVALQPGKNWKQNNIVSETKTSKVEETSREWSHLYKQEL